MSHLSQKQEVTKFLNAYNDIFEKETIIGRTDLVQAAQIQLGCHRR